MLTVSKMGTPTPVTGIELEDKLNGAPLASRPLFISKPSWVVRTESNVRKHVRKKPDPPCVVCQGTGRVDCFHCYGKGRTNHVHLAMLPKGEWPKWCKTCGGSGLGYCSRCLGTGEYRSRMGFHFMEKDSDNKKPKIRASQGVQTAADRFLLGEQSDSEQDV
ncbi:uncharacterized protein LOC123209734 [Mangifera indica]|uniref:uncharacterized protein LOC123209734 n=1 Tax=Mangifera indica TaxID=29780 RepID=UPI001CFB4A58|nr:uncharacterized protein LOC123209734 [Mangifera indica]XP_044483801.1 uncharacterized protein LOC123209734 [Mangifera indica]